MSEEAIGRALRRPRVLRGLWLIACIAALATPARAAAQDVPRCEAREGEPPLLDRYDVGWTAAPPGEPLVVEVEAIDRVLVRYEESHHTWFFSYRVRVRHACRPA